MNQEQINTKLDELLNNPKTKNYLNHLVQNYIPLNKISKVEEEPKGDFKCAILKNDLISYEGFLKTNESVTQNATLKEPVSSIIDHETLALTGQNTNTYMSFKAYKMFYEWVVNQVSNNNKHVSWLLGNVNRREFVNNFKNIETKPINNINKTNTKDKPKTERATFALGDLNALQELKNKLKNK